MSERIVGFDKKIDYLIKHGRWAEVRETAEQFEAYQKLMTPLCYYESRWLDEVGEIMVCQVHDDVPAQQNMLNADPHANCQTADGPWRKFQRDIDEAMSKSDLSPILRNFRPEDWPTYQAFLERFVSTKD